MDLCKYKNILGEPGKGIHSYRLFGVAIADVIMTIIAAALISYFFKYSFIATLVILFILGVVLHKLFCVKTTIDKLLFPN
jgi:hypothetical protein